MEENKALQENKMGYMPINKLILSISAPIMISMFVQSLYNMVDSIFVSRIGEYAITSVALSLPLQQLMFAVGIGTSIGVNSYVSRNLGAKNFEESNKAANNGIILSFLSFLIFFAVGSFFSRNILEAQTDVEKIINGGHIYLQICCMGSLGIFMHLMFERILQSTGKTVYTMVAQCIGAILNIILDPILIFGMFNMPKLGLAGAAIATVISQWVGALVVMYFSIWHNEEVKISPKFMKPDWKIIKEIYRVGAPSIIMVSIVSVTIFSYNKILSKFSTTAVAVIGIYFRIQGFIFMPLFGLNNGLIAIVAYNYGANKIDRMKESINTGLKYGLFIMTFGFIVMQVFPDKLLMMFNASDELLKIGVICFRVISISFIFASISIISSGVFQAVGNGILSMIISITRQIFVLIPVAYFFSLTGNVNLVWLGTPVAEVVSAIMCIIGLKKLYKKTDEIAETM